MENFDQEEILRALDLVSRLRENDDMASIVDELMTIENTNKPYEVTDSLEIVFKRLQSFATRKYEDLVKKGAYETTRKIQDRRIRAQGGL